MGNTESIAMENENPMENETVTHTRTRRRRRRFQAAQHEMYESNSTEENSWWSNIENENLILNQVPTELTTLTDVGESENNADDSILQKNSVENVNLTLKRSINNNNNINNDNNNVLNEIKNDIDEKPSVCVENENEKIQKIDNHEIVSPTEYRGRLERVSTIREQSFEEFREELRQKRMARQTAVQDLRDEIATLRKQLNTEQALTQCLRQKHEVNKSDEDISSNEIVNEDCTDNGACALDTDDIDPMSRGRHANIELANAQLALQLANSENISLRAELGVVQKQVGTLKEVISCCKQMLNVKEEQCNELKAKLTEIETSFGEREMKIMSENLRHEYERQLGNIRQLRELYEERQRISAAEHENLQRLISIKKDELLAEQEKTKNFEERNQTLIKEVESANKELATLREECNEHKFEKKALKEEMGAVNTLFSQMVMGFNGKNNLDIDRLTTMLEENRSLLNDMATKEVSCTDGATLPKLLFELVEQATLSSSTRTSRSSTPALQENTTTESEDETEEKEKEEQHTNHNENVATNMNNDVVKNVENVDAAECATSICYGATATEQVNIVTNGNYNVIPRRQQRRNSSNIKTKLHATTSSLLPSSSSTGAMTMKFHEPEVIGKVASTQEIIGNLPKVWKVLMELLSHHKIEQVQFEETGNSEDCYKSVETPNGPKAELSVSKTYIKLKDLILEKKSLVKETNRLKTLNSHLECRLNTQEKRLSTVSLELTKTWHLVGKMQRQHRQLHTQEQILRYQLQQKRRLLSELKEELEYCRRKWAAARAKNDESQEQCNDLRREFARRKLEDANNSAESGYSDSGPPSDEEERCAVAGCVNSRRKRLQEMFEHTRKIKRMQSTSPGRAAACSANTTTTGSSNDNNAMQETEIVLRWNSAPPTCGWRRDNDDDDDDDEEEELPPRLLVVSRGNGGAIPKQNVERRYANPDAERESDAGSSGTERSTRIQRLEEQCKSLIQQVLETSDNRERLEVQLCRFQDEIAPVQYAVPLEEFINRRRNERMSRASSAPATGSLTPREEEYTRKRSERLERLEEESRQLMSRIKRTSDRGHYLRCSLDRIRRVPNREESFDSGADDDDAKKVDVKESIGETCQVNPSEKSPLTAEEEAYTARRAARLRRLEEEGKQLLGTLSRNAQRGSTLENKLDNLHERYGNNEEQEKSDSKINSTQELSTSGSSIAQRLEDINQVTANRAERLRLLEEEGHQLIARLSSTSERGTRMINRIAEHAQKREARVNATANSRSEPAEADSASVENATTDDTPAATALLPTPKNVACSSIVSDEVTECVTVTTTPSQVATRELGAVPKSKPMAQLCAARHKSERFTSEKRVTDDDATCSSGESLEEMVKRLRDTPYPKGMNQKELENSSMKEEKQEEFQKETDKAKHEQNESTSEK